MSATYELRTIADLLKVPSDRREACVHELLLSLALHDLAFGEDRADVETKGFVWTDDGDHSVSLEANGQHLLKLEVTAGVDAPGESG